MTKLGKFFRNPYTIFSYLGTRGLLNWMPDGPYLQLIYRARTGKRLNLNNPQSFNEKLQWLKLHDRNPRYTRLVDKCLVKDEVGRILGTEFVVPTLGAWDDASQIDFARLPKEFVLKVNHDSGGVIICRDKGRFDASQAVSSLNRQLKRSYYFSGREWPYKDVPPRVFAEKYLDSKRHDSAPNESPDHLSSGRYIQGVSEQLSIVDYKFFCFHGEPRFLNVQQDMREGNKARFAFMNLDWTPASFGRIEYPEYETLPPRPERLNEMIKAAKLLAKGIPFVRVDFFEHEGNVMFSEMTFYPTSGMIPFKPSSAERALGDWIDISKVAP